MRRCVDPFGNDTPFSALKKGGETIRIKRITQRPIILLPWTCASPFPVDKLKKKKRQVNPMCSVSVASTRNHRFPYLRWIGSRWWDLRSDAASQRQQHQMSWYEPFVSRRFILTSFPSRSFLSSWPLSFNAVRCCSLEETTIRPIVNWTKTTKLQWRMVIAEAAAALFCPVAVTASWPFISAALVFFFLLRNPQIQDFPS